jgi:hypothetical protein
MDAGRRTAGEAQSSASGGVALTSLDRPYYHRRLCKIELTGIPA